MARKRRRKAKSRKTITRKRRKSTKRRTPAQKRATLKMIAALKRSRK